MPSPNSNRFEFEFVSIFDASLQMADAPNPLKLSDIECCRDTTNPITGLRTCNCQLKLQIQENKAFHRRYCLPLPSADAVVGVLHLYLPVSYKLTQDQRDFFGSIVPEIVLSIMNANLIRTGELREAAFQTEKLRLANDLHDTLGQDLAYLRNTLEQLIQNQSAHGTVLEEDFNQMFMAAEEANQTVRNILAVTRSNQGSALGDRMLAYAKAIGERAKLHITLESQGRVETLSQHMQFQVFLIFREALANIEKHAKAQKVTITLHWSEDELAIAITDDGRGFLTDRLDQRSHFGLTIIETRTRELNGHLAIVSAPNEGTKISIRVPISHDEFIRLIESEQL
jgi:signal transduction histidine kinase